MVEFEVEVVSKISFAWRKGEGVLPAPTLFRSANGIYFLFFTVLYFWFFSKYKLIVSFDLAKK